jgi:hypothetical protein
MTDHRPLWLAAGTYALAVSLGLLTAWFDVAAPFGDDTSKCTIVLWLLSSGILGFLQPRRPWRWALLVGLGVPACHIARHALDLPDTINPNTYTTSLILVPIALGVCGFAAWVGSCLGHAIRGGNPP